jgi:hypothetical protein
MKLRMNSNFIQQAKITIDKPKVNPNIVGCVIIDKLYLSKIRPIFYFFNNKTLINAKITCLVRV